jgi:hypothetical protein
MAIARVVLTYEDYAALPADGRRYELHAGGLSVTPAPGSRHQEVSAHLFVVRYLHVKAERLGKVLAAPIGGGACWPSSGGAASRATPRLLARRGTGSPGDGE